MTAVRGDTPPKNDGGKSRAREQLSRLESAQWFGPDQIGGWWDCQDKQEIDLLEHLPVYL